MTKVKITYNEYNELFLMQLAEIIGGHGYDSPAIFDNEELIGNLCVPIISTINHQALINDLQKFSNITLIEVVE